MVEYKASYGDYSEWYNSLSRDDWNSYQLTRFPDACTCDACFFFETKARRLYIMSDLPPMPKERMFKKFIDDWHKSCIRMPKQPRKTGNGKPKGLFAGTFTVSPTDPYNEDDMIKAVNKLFTQKTCPVNKYAWYLEYTDRNLPHVHFIYETNSGGKILPKVFKRVWPIWDEAIPCGSGHRGGYHASVADPEGYLKYIAKDNGRHGMSGFV